MLVLLSTATVFAQQNEMDESAKSSRVQHTLFFELMGSSVFYGLNYDLTFRVAERHKIAVGLSLCHIPGFITSIVPQTSYFFGRRHHLEVGIGYAHLRLWNGDGGNFYVMRIGYRHQRENGGLFWRIAFTPSVNHPLTDLALAPGAGIAVGYTFNSSL